MAAHVVELLGHGIGDGGAHAAAHHGHPLQALGLGGPAQGAHEVLEGLPLPLVVELFGGGPHHLIDDGDGAPLPVEIGDGQGDPLPLLVHPEDDELAGLGLPGHGGGLDLHQGHGGVEHPFFHDPIHSFSSFLWIGHPASHKNISVYGTPRLIVNIITHASPSVNFIPLETALQIAPSAKKEDRSPGPPHLLRTPAPAG